MAQEVSFSDTRLPLLRFSHEAWHPQPLETTASFSFSSDAAAVSTSLSPSPFPIG